MPRAWLISGAILIALVGCRAEDLDDAERYASAGDLARARTIANRVLDETPESSEVLFIIGRIELIARDLESAADALSRAAGASPEMSPRIAREYWSAARRVYSTRPFTIDSFFAGAASEALAHDESLAGEMTEWTLRAARTEAANENSEKAMRLLEVGSTFLAEEREAFAGLMEEIARAALLEKNLAEGERSILRAAAVNPTMRSRLALFYRDLAVEYAAQENLDTAREKLAKALEYEPFLAETDDDVTWLMRVKLQSSAPTGARFYLESFPFGKYRADAEMLVAGETTVDGPNDPVQATILAIRHLASAVEKYASDQSAYPLAENVDEMASILGEDVPIADGWGRVFRCVSSPTRGYRIVSAGSDAEFDAGSGVFGVPSALTTTPEDASDIIFESGRFLQYPEPPSEESVTSSSAPSATPRVAP